MQQIMPFVISFAPLAFTIGAAFVVPPWARALDQLHEGVENWKASKKVGAPQTA